MPQPDPAPAAPVFWAEGRIYGSTVVLARSADEILGAALTAYDPEAPSVERLASRQRIAESMVARFHEMEIRAGEAGCLRSPWTLTGQTRVVRNALMADRSAPLPDFIHVWPSNQPRLVVAAHLTNGHPAPTGNVRVLNPATAGTFRNSLAADRLLSWGCLE